MKNNIDFYQHYANADQHPKFKMLRVQFGWSGEGKFWALNNRIAQSNDCCLNVLKKYNKAAIANDLDFNIQEFDEFIEFLKVDCELIQECEPGIITTDIIQENFEKVSEKRIKNQKYYKQTLSDSLRNSQSTEKEIQQAENIQSKVKESKVNKSKVKKKIFTPPTKEESQQYFIDNGYTKQSGLKAWEYYDAGDWKDSTGKSVKSWKQKMRGVWFKDENKINNNSFNEVEYEGTKPEDIKWLSN